MKIDSGSLPPESTRVNQTPGSTTGGCAPKAGGASTSSGDVVEVSSGAQLAAEAVRQLSGAASEDDVRTEMVERAKAAIANGEVGVNLDGLADKIIDGLLGE